MDLYSRNILGAIASKHLLTEETTIPCIKDCIKHRKRKDFEGLIIHSDGGGQYYSKDFRKLTQQAGIRTNMAKDVYENPHAERVNGKIKNEYLAHYKPNNFEELKKHLKKL